MKVGFSRSQHTHSWCNLTVLLGQRVNLMTLMWEHVFSFTHKGKKRAKSEHPACYFTIKSTRHHYETSEIKGMTSVRRCAVTDEWPSDWNIEKRRTLTLTHFAVFINNLYMFFLNAGRISSTCKESKAIHWAAFFLFLFFLPLVS